MLRFNALFERFLRETEDAAVLKVGLVLNLMVQLRGCLLEAGRSNWLGGVSITRGSFVSHSFLLKHLADLHCLVSSNLGAVVSFEDATVKSRGILLTHDLYILN